MNAQKDAALIGNTAMGMPGYGELKGIGDYYSYGKNDTDYVDKYADKFDPNQFFGDMFTNGEGGQGLVGADQLAEFGEGAYELFDKFRPGMEYMAENQGISDAELSNMLSESSSGYQGNIANQESQQVRQMQRMGIDPSSGAWADGAGNRAMQGAAGLSGLQQKVRTDARGQDWMQRLQAAGIGLASGQMGTDALGKATSSYDNAYNAMTDAYGNYISGVGNLASLTENNRQYNAGQTSSSAQGLTQAVPNFQNAQQSAAGLHTPRFNTQQFQPAYR